MGFTAMDHDKCVFKCQPFHDKPPIHIGLFVDDFIYYSKSDEVEQWFEANLKAHAKAGFMGDASWLLGQRYGWLAGEGENASCRAPQQAFAEAMLRKLSLQHICPAKAPCRPGLKAGRAEEDPFSSPEGIRRCQQAAGCLSWLATSTRPGTSTALSLLSQFSSKPSPGHWEAAKHALKYLRGAASHGIWLRQGEARLEGSAAIPEELRGLETILLAGANWGPQDASQPKENEARAARMEELKSMQGLCLARMGGPMLWGAHREKRGSRSSCIAELKAAGEGAKGAQCLRHLMKQLGLPGIGCPALILSGSRGAVGWIDSGCKPTKKLRHENLAELGIAEAKQYGEVSF